MRAFRVAMSRARDALKCHHGEQAAPSIVVALRADAVSLYSSMTD